MSEFGVVYTVALRELIRYSRSKERIVGSLSAPIFIFLIFGFGLGTSVSAPGMHGQYSDFIAPGVVAMTVLFTSAFSGISVVWDKEFGFMKEMLVAPVSRLSIVLGKAIGGAATATIQGSLMLLLSVLMGVTLSLLQLAILIPLIFLISLGFVGMGLILASFLNNLEGFPIIMQFVVLPMFFLSGALFPLDNLPSWIKAITLINPLTYGVELLRYAMLGITSFQPAVSLAIVSLFTAATLSASAYLFNRIE